MTTESKLIEDILARVRAKERHMLDPLTVEEIVRETIAVAFPAIRERCAEAVVKRAVELERRACCGNGQRTSDPWEVDCCGSPDYMISESEAEAAIRALSLDAPPAAGAIEAAERVMARYPKTIAALARFEAAKEKTAAEWQPIKTAPRDENGA